MGERLDQPLLALHMEEGARGCEPRPAHALKLREARKPFVSYTLREKYSRDPFLNSDL